MTCTVCGSNARCGCAQIVGVVSSGNCGCGNSPCTCCQNVVRATPSPYYNCAPACAQGHQQKITIQQFSADIKIQDSWNVPACGDTAVVTSVQLTDIVVGSYIWNPTYGFFEVTAFNPSTNQITILNHCNDGNAAEGTNVPSCTEFVVTTPPCECPSEQDVCVAIDFTAPAVDACVDITLTTVGTINAGDIVLIGTGRYTVHGIVSSTVINICNDLGEGITPGTPVIARNSAGQYNYCITVVQTCCTEIQENFPDGLTPCTDFEYRVDASQDTSDPLDLTIASEGGTADTDIATITINNSSTCRTMKVLVDVLGTVDTSGPSNTYEYTVTLKQSVDGGGYTIVQYQTYLDTNEGFGAKPLAITFFNVLSVAPGASVTLAYKVTFDNVYPSPDFDLVLTAAKVQVAAIGMAA